MDYSDIPGGGHKKIKGPAHMVEGGNHLRKDPTPHPHFLSQGNYDLFTLLNTIKCIWNLSKVCYTKLASLQQDLTVYISLNLQKLLWQKIITDPFYFKCMADFYH